MNRWTYTLIALVLIPVQTTWLTAVGMHAIRPDLVLLLIYFTGFYAGEMKGLMIGWIMGALMDFFSGGPFGLQIASKAAAGLLSGLLGRFFLNATGALTMGLVVLLSLITGIIGFWFHQLVVGEIHFMEAFRWTLLPEALYNGVLGGAVFWVVIRRLPVRQPWSESPPFLPNVD
ncbi:MAG TPA: rod shape-determining protein MreD [Nitrospiria bacterium]|jgi:rod shape-determining protein MreD|nr:rod shape-determining protein MreD [Nitrospiria bacterium]